LISLLLFSLGLLFPVLMCGNTTYTYTSSSVNVTFETTVNPIVLPSGTNITSDLVAGSFSMTYPSPATDVTGFPLGVGSQYSNFTLSTIEIGTDAAGNITSWDILGTQFASYPGSPDGNPNDFYCQFSVSFSQSGGSGSLAVDDDLGFCPSSDDTVANGVWNTLGESSSAPEPGNLFILGAGFLSTLALAARRKRLVR
jgi:hypothetical protein